jgi:hypothetical protein
MLTSFGADDGRATDLGGELSTTGWGKKRPRPGVGAKEVDCNPFNTTPMTSPCQGYDATAMMGCRAVRRQMNLFVVGCVIYRSVLFRPST